MMLIGQVGICLARLLWEMGELTLRIRLGKDILIRCRWKCGDDYSLGCLFTTSRYYLETHGIEVGTLGL
jgi:hypothetical protein